jgi:hypothetical protein
MRAHQNIIAKLRDDPAEQLLHIAGVSVSYGVGDHHLIDTRPDETLDRLQHVLLRHIAFDRTAEGGGETGRQFEPFAFGLAVAQIAHTFKLGKGLIGAAPSV